MFLVIRFLVRVNEEACTNTGCLTLLTCTTFLTLLITFLEVELSYVSISGSSLNETDFLTFLPWNPWSLKLMKSSHWNLCLCVKVWLVNLNNGWGGIITSSTDSSSSFGSDGAFSGSFSGSSSFTSGSLSMIFPSATVDWPSGWNISVLYESFLRP